MAIASPVARPVVESQVLDVVAGLVRELAGGTGKRPNLDDALDRDLGISSLERVELLLRLEQAFGVRPADSVMVEAATPRDLVAAILEAAPAGEATPVVRQAAIPATQAPTSIPTEARSLLEALRWHTDRSPDRIHIHLRNDDGTEVPITYRDLLVARGHQHIARESGEAIFANQATA
jgi:acyl carrier protein